MEVEGRVLLCRLALKIPVRIGIIVLAPIPMLRGICTSDYSLFPWKNVRRPVYPLDQDVDPGF